MPKINRDAVKEARNGGGNVLIDAGTYEAEIVSVKKQPFKKDGPVDNAYNIGWRLTDRNHKFVGARVFENILLDEKFESGKDNFKLAIIAAILEDADLIEIDDDGNFDWPEDELDIVNAEIVRGIRITHNEYNGNTYANVAGIVNEDALERGIEKQLDKPTEKADTKKKGLFV